MNKQVSPAIMAGAILVAVLVVGFFIFHAVQPAPTPHPDPARFLPHASGPAPASSVPALPASR